MEFRSRVLATGVIAGLMITGAGAAYAGTTYESFSTTVGRVNGSGYTGSQEKAIGGAFVQLRGLSVGGGYEVDARAQQSDGSNSGAWERNLVSGSSANLSNAIDRGKQTRVHFSNDVTTRVNVQVSGDWRSQ